ncbi:MAG: type II secretion system F family protein [Lacisediminihabitans sp.]
MSSAQTFAYTSRDAGGKLVKGKMEAQSESVVVTRLRTMGLSPVTIGSAGAGTGLNREINLGGFTKGVKPKDLAVVTRQMATMVAAGLSLLRTLAIISEQTENKTLAQVFTTVRGDVEAGKSLSDAMGKHTREFPPLMLNLIRAGEVGGFLEGALESVANNFEAEVKLTGQIKAALSYPIVVLVIAIISVAAMLIFIVPVFEKMFAQMGAKLPLPTQFLVDLSHGMVFIGPIVVVGGIALAIWWKKSKNELKVRRVVDPLRLRMPVFGELMKKVAIARVTRNLATMVGSGVPILRALQVVGATSGNWVIESALTRAGEAVRNGSTIAEPLAKEKVFPSMVTQMIAVGEDSGALETMLHKVSDFYDQEVESMTEQLTALIEPIMIAVIGVLIGGMIVALYMPIFDIYGHIH